MVSESLGAGTTTLSPAPSERTLRVKPRRTGQRDMAVLACLVVFTVALPQLASSGTLFLWETVAIQAVFALGTNLLIGHTDIHTLGQAAFYGAGGYTVAVLSTNGWVAPAALVAAILVGGLIGAFVGGLSYRIAGMGTLMVTVAVAQAFYSLSGRSKILGGDNGMSAMTSGFPSIVDDAYWYAILGICFGAGAVMWLIVHSPFGATLHAIRDDPMRVVHLGINVRFYRVVVFVLSGAFCGLAGGLTGYTQSAVSPEFFFWLISGNALIMCVLGGLTSFWGPAIGAVVYTLLVHELQTQFPTTSILGIGVVLLLLVLVAPKGLVSAPATLRKLAYRVQKRQR